MIVIEARRGALSNLGNDSSSFSQEGKAAILTYTSVGFSPHHPCDGKGSYNPLYRQETQGSSKLPKATQFLDDRAWSSNTEFCGVAQGVMVAARVVSPLVTI